MPDVHDAKEIGRVPEPQKLVQTTDEWADDDCVASAADESESESEGYATELLTLEDMFADAVERREYEDVQWMHEALAVDPMWQCNGQVLRHAVEDGEDAFVLWHLTHCAAPTPAWVMPWVVTCDRVHVLEHLLRNGLGTDDVEGAIKVAASEGSLDVLRWLHEHVQDGWTGVAMDWAAGSGRLDVVQWLHATRPEGRTTNALDWAASTGFLDVVQWLHTNRTEGCTSDAMDSAAEHGHLDIVQWLHTTRSEGCTTSAMDEAAANGHVDIVQWLHSNRTEGCTPWAMDMAAARGDLGLVRWFHDNRSEGCTSFAMDMAAARGEIEVVQWLHANRSEGCTTSAMDHAASNGHLDMVQWLHANRTEGCTTLAMNYAAESGLLDVVQWLHAIRSEGCTTSAMNSAAENGYLSVVQWLHANRTEGCTTDAMDSAAKNGHLEVVQWLDANRNEGCTQAAMNLAAENGDLEIVQWLDANRFEGCTKWAMDKAARNGHLHVVQWLNAHRTEGCTSAATDMAAAHGHLDVVQWLFANRTGESSAGAMNAAISLRNLELVREVFDSPGLHSWPRPGHASTLAKLVQSDYAVDREILKHIVLCRQARYRPEGTDTPEEYEVVIPSRAVEEMLHTDQHGRPFVLTAGMVVCQIRNIPIEIAMQISEFIIQHPAEKITHDSAVQHGLTHWLVLFSAHPSESMVDLAELGYVQEACLMHMRLARKSQVQCTKRLLYLTVKAGDVDEVKWHMLNCEAHSVDEWLYVTTWIGQVDVLKWMCAEWSSISSTRHQQLKVTVGPPKKTLFHSMDASFHDVGARFDVDMADVEASMDKFEQFAQSGDVRNVYEQGIASRRAETNMADLAAIHGHFDVAAYLLLGSHPAACTVSGLYGAIVQGHFRIVQRIYEDQQELFAWPKQEDGQVVLRCLLASSTAELRTKLLQSNDPRREEASLKWLLAFFRNQRDMRLDPTSLNEAARGGDRCRVELICRFALVDTTADAADIAATRGDLPMLQVLLAGESTEPKYTTRAMDGAAEGGHLQVVQYLHQLGARCTRHAVDFSAKNGHADVVEYLLRHCQAGCSPYALYWATFSGHLDVVRCLVSLSVPANMDKCLQVARDRGYDTIASILDAYRQRHDHIYGLQASSRQLARCGRRRATSR